MTIKRTQIALLISIIICIYGCETRPARQDVVGKMEADVEQSVSSNAQQEEVPENIAQALVPTINLDISKVPQIEDEQRFDISVNNVPAEQFFLSLVDGTQYNMVIHPEVRGSVTLNLRNVTIPDVMEAARDVYGFEFVSTPYGFQVLPGRLRARIYQINYLNVERQGSSQTQVSSGSLTQSEEGGDSSDGDGGGDSDSSDGSDQNVTPATSSQIRTQQPPTTFWSELQSSVQAIVGTGEGRSVVVNPQSGVVVVRALPNELREVEAFLQATQLIVQRQVILEAKILEVELSDKYQAGINWAGVLSSGDNTIKAANIGGGSVLINEAGQSAIGGETGNLDPDNFNPVEGALADAFGGVFVLALNLGDFKAFIELLKTQGNVQVLSSPRVATMNNQKAIIKVGTDEFFVTEVTNTVSSTGVTTNVFPSIELTPFFSGIALDVTPQISEGGEVTLHIHPSVSEVVDQQKTVTIGNVTQQLPLALSSVRESDSIVRARNGQVVVIGGLMQDKTDDREASAPVLGDIPVLGNLFRHTRNVSVKSELVILLKPIVVGGSEDWNGSLNQSSGELKQLRESMDDIYPKSFLNDLFKPVEEQP